MPESKRGQTAEEFNLEIREAIRREQRFRVREGGEFEWRKKDDPDGRWRHLRCELRLANEDFDNETAFCSLPGARGDATLELLRWGPETQGQEPQFCYLASEGAAVGAELEKNLKRIAREESGVPFRWLSATSLRRIEQYRRTFMRNASVLRRSGVAAQMRKKLDDYLTANPDRWPSGRHYEECRAAVINAVSFICAGKCETKPHFGRIRSPRRARSETETVADDVRDFLAEVDEELYLRDAEVFPARADAVTSHRERYEAVEHFLHFARCSEKEFSDYLAEFRADQLREEQLDEAIGRIEDDILPSSRKSSEGRSAGSSGHDPSIRIAAAESAADRRNRDAPAIENENSIGCVR